MPSNKESDQEENKGVDIPKSVMDAIGAVAKGIGVAATELWTIFVRQYLVRGVTEAFTGIVLCVASFFLQPVIGLWILVPLGIALLFFYGSILLIGNPKYYALEDITKRIKDFRESDAKARLRYY